MNKPIITPSNWLFNSGIIGLLRVLGSSSATSKNLLDKDGSVDQDALFCCIQEQLSNQKTEELRPPFNNMPRWIWNWLKNTFEWNYGSVSSLVQSSLRRATAKGANKSQILKQLQLGELQYDEMHIPISSLNEKIKYAFTAATGRTPKLRIEKAQQDIVQAIDENREAYVVRKAIGHLFSQNGPYQNLYNPGWFGDLRRLFEFFKFEEITRPSITSTRCFFCGGKRYNVEPLDACLMSSLFPVFSKFPNAYWVNEEKQVTLICSFCRFALLHHHLALTRLTDRSEFFVNAPSFQVMLDLNEIVQAMFGGAQATINIGKREALAMSVIEYSLRRTSTLGAWTEMNIEIVAKREDEIRYHNLPHDVMRIISDRDITPLLSNIDELKILSLILAQEQSRLVNIGYGLLRESLTGGNRTPIADEWLFRWTNKGPALKRTAEKILLLYALIEQKQRRISYGSTIAAV